MGRLASCRVAGVISANVGASISICTMAVLVTFAGTTARAASFDCGRRSEQQRWLRMRDECTNSLASCLKQVYRDRLRDLATPIPEMPVHFEAH